MASEPTPLSRTCCFTHAKVRASIADAGDRLLILILSDINMPGMNGLELLPKAKALRPDVPIIMITAYGDAETKRKAL
jgi:CheY-like chemotaxis protein